MGIKVVTDTNVPVSALLFGGTPGKLITLWKEKRIIPFICKEMENELLRVLAYPKFCLSKQEIEYLFYQEIMPYFQNIRIEQGEVIKHQIDKEAVYV